MSDAYSALLEQEQTIEKQMNDLYEDISLREDQGVDTSAMNAQMKDLRTQMSRVHVQMSALADDIEE